jgi:FtsP/CotA-like multicopper oxidase with cupredoxin domain
MISIMALSSRGQNGYPERACKAPRFLDPVPGWPYIPPTMSRQQSLTRRRILQALGASAAAGVLVGRGLFARAVWAAPHHGGMAPAADAGREFFLTIDLLPFSPSGKKRTAVAVNGSVPGPTLRWKEGEPVTIHVTNNLKEPTSIHWHGILVPQPMDGVPGVSFPGIAPGETFTYAFTVKQAGTYWYHSHSDYQEQLGLYGAMVIDPAGPDPVVSDREQVIFLSDWSDENPKRIMANLKRLGGYYNWNKRTLGDFVRDAKAKGFNDAFRDHKMWAAMRMTPTDIADVTGYTFLLNGKTAAENEWAPARPGERVRLRIVNGSAMTFFDVRIPGLKMAVVQADGQNVHPVMVDEIRMAPAETYDVVVEPMAGPYTFFAEAMDRSGYARATLSAGEGEEAPIPALSPRPVRTMADMPGMDHGGHGDAPADDAGMEGMAHASHGMGAMADMTEAGPKTLDYADLMPLDHRHAPPPAREIDVVLGGNMERFIWTINGKRMQDALPIAVGHNERVRLTFENRTMMEHPMHLHGMFVELVNAKGMAGARKHTVIVPPNRTVSVDLTADAPGAWAFHCHMLFHMLAGMFTTLAVAEPSGEMEMPHGHH